MCVCFNICQFILKDLIEYADEKERRARSGRVACGQLLSAWNFTVLPFQRGLPPPAWKLPQYFLLKKTILSPLIQFGSFFFFPLKTVCVYVYVSVDR